MSKLLSTVLLLASACGATRAAALAPSFAAASQPPPLDVATDAAADVAPDATTTDPSTTPGSADESADSPAEPDDATASDFYYRQFIEYVDQQGNEHGLDTITPGQIPGSFYVAYMDVWLATDGTYVAHYKEYSRETEMWISNVEYTGRWWVDPDHDTLHLENFGIGDRARLDQGDGIRITMPDGTNVILGMR